MKAPRPGSRKAAIYRAFCEKGAEYAQAQGELHKLKASTVRSWVVSWSKETSSKRERVRTKRTSERVRIRPYAELSQGARVMLYYDTRALGIVAKKGPEVSEVKFDDKVTRYIPNRHLLLVETGK